MKVQYSIDEWYPVYILSKPVENNIFQDLEIDIPSKKYKEYVDAMKKFENIQDYICDFLRKKSGQAE
jgi:hypothetical protein